MTKATRAKAPASSSPLAGACLITLLAARRVIPSVPRRRRVVLREARLRRYCAANRLNRLGTLTYADANHDPIPVREHSGEFFRALRDSLDDDALPFAWAPEWHKTGHGLHAQSAVGRYVKPTLIVEAWGRGFVHVKLIGSPVGSGALGESRIAASYLSKYVAKSSQETEGA